MRSFKEWCHPIKALSRVSKIQINDGDKLESDKLRLKQQNNIGIIGFDMRIKEEWVNFMGTAGRNNRQKF